MLLAISLLQFFMLHSLQVVVRTVDRVGNALKFMIHLRAIGDIVTIDFRRVIVCDCAVKRVLK